MTDEHFKTIAGIVIDNVQTIQLLGNTLSHILPLKEIPILAHHFEQMEAISRHQIETLRVLADEIGIPFEAKQNPPA